VIKIVLKELLRAAIIASVLVGVIFAVSAYIEPTEDPPGGNVAAPINTGDNIQTKSGGLNILGRVGIGTNAPDADRALSIAGTASVKDLYLTEPQDGSPPHWVSNPPNPPSLFGQWSEKSENTVYTAETDGFVVVRPKEVWREAAPIRFCLITIETPQDVVRSAMVFLDSVSARSSGISPVRKGDTWRVYNSFSADGCPTMVYWIPLGS